MTARDIHGAVSAVKTIVVKPGISPQLSDAALAHQKYLDGGKALMLSLDCKGCHKIDEKSVGPAFIEISKKYPHTAAVNTKLSKKIMTGGTGVWGDVMMPAHSTLKPDQAKQIVEWVLSLSNKK